MSEQMVNEASDDVTSFYSKIPKQQNSIWMRSMFVLSVIILVYIFYDSYAKIINVHLVPIPSLSLFPCYFIDQNKSVSIRPVLYFKTSDIDAGQCMLVSGNIVKCLPSFVVVGAMKSGTGALLRSLNNHGLFASGFGEKIKKGVKQRTNEMHYFTEKFRRYNRTRQRIKHDWRDYLQMFPPFPITKNISIKDANSSLLEFCSHEKSLKLTFDKSPDYMRSKTAIASLHEMLPSVKLIIILRDPLERTLSEFNHNCRHNRYFRLLQDYDGLPKGKILLSTNSPYVPAHLTKKLAFPCKANIHLTCQPILSDNYTTVGSADDFHKYITNNMSQVIAQPEVVHSYYDQQIRDILQM